MAAEEIHRLYRGALVVTSTAAKVASPAEE